MRALRAVFVLGAGLRVAVALLPERLLLRVTIDDSLYYVRVAQELVAGHGSTFDGIHATNGYHPLWLLVVSPFAAVLEGTGLVRVLVVVQTVLACATFLLAARLLVPRFGAFATALGLAVWWLNPFSVLTSQSGVETSLACLAVVLTVWAALRYVDAPGVRAACLLGAAAGVAFLARSDTAFATLAIGFWVLARTRPGRSPRSWPWRDAAATVAAGSAVVLPWLTWNLVRFGTIEQASTWARPMVEWDLLEREASSAGSAAWRASTAATEASQYLLQRWPVVLGWSPMLLLAGAIGALWYRYRHGFAWTDRSRPLMALAVALLVAGTALAAVHSGIRLVPREYYFEWARLALGIVVGGLAAAARPDPQRTAPSPSPSPTDGATSPSPSPSRVVLLGCSLLAAVMLLATARTVTYLREPAYSWQEDMVTAGRWLDEHADPDDRVLSFNAGIIGFYSQRAVVNLDGVINNSALEALESSELAEYMCDTGAAWYVDFEPIMLDEHERFLGASAGRLQLEPVAEIHSATARPYRDSTLTIHRFSCSPR